MLSIVICTYNRAIILERLLASLEPQLMIFNRRGNIELLVIDNNSKDNTKSIAQEYIIKIKNMRYIHEPIQGLSSARNRGFQEAKGDYVGYIDDDCITINGWVETALEVIDNITPDLFGGGYIPWYEIDKPKWFKDSYATKDLGNVPRYLKQDEFLSGGNFFIKKALFPRGVAFRPDYGMNGEKIGFGEETYLQLKLRKEINNLKIYYHPALLVQHRVAPDKFKISKRIDYAYKDGKDWRRLINSVYPQRKPNNRIKSLLRLLLSLLICLGSLSIGALLRNRTKYPYPENYWFEISSGKIRSLGGEFVNAFL